MPYIRIFDYSSSKQSHRRFDHLRWTPPPSAPRVPRYGHDMARMATAICWIFVSCHRCSLNEAAAEAHRISRVPSQIPASSLPSQNCRRGWSRSSTQPTSSSPCTARHFRLATAAQASRRCRPPTWPTRSYLGSCRRAPILRASALPARNNSAWGGA
jgi:hypothetical protein